MKSYLVKLKPMEPYFFGNEKTFGFSGEKNQGQMRNSYYIKSERTPLQTTLLGAMRYLFLLTKTYRLDDANKARVGYRSFDVDAEDQTFGKIAGVSPLFLLKESEKLVVAPFDCDNRKDKDTNEFISRSYVPFGSYREIKTSRGRKLYTPEYVAKNGIRDCYMNVDDGSLTPAGDIFIYEDRVGNKKQLQGKSGDKSFFKKQYCNLKKDYAFGFYLTLDDTMTPPKGVSSLFLGQGKSLFSVTFREETDEIDEKLADLLGRNALYFRSDSFVYSDIYAFADFAVTQLRDYRAYKTSAGGRVEKGDKLHKLIKAGSVLIVSDTDACKKMIARKNCQIIGFNRVVISSKT